MMSGEILETSSLSSPILLERVAAFHVSTRNEEEQAIVEQETECRVVFIFQSLAEIDLIQLSLLITSGPSQ